MIRLFGRIAPASAAGPLTGHPIRVAYSGSSPALYPVEAWAAGVVVAAAESAAVFATESARAAESAMAAESGMSVDRTPSSEAAGRVNQNAKRPSTRADVKTAMVRVGVGTFNFNCMGVPQATPTERPAPPGGSQVRASSTVWSATI